MAVSWETVAVPLMGGLDTKTDAKLVLPTKLQTLQNGIFTHGIAAAKRFGYTRHRPLLSSTEELTGFRNCFARSDEVVQANTTNLYSLDSSLGRYIEVGTYDPVTHRASEVARLLSEQTSVSGATNNDITVYAWEDSRGGIRGAVYHEATGAVFNADWTIATANAERPHVVPVAGNLLVFYYTTDNDNIVCRVVSTQSVLASLDNASVDVVVDASSNGVFDVHSDGDTAYLFYASDGTVVTGARVAKVNASGVATSLATATSRTITRAAVTVSADTVYVAYYDNTTVYAASWDLDLVVDNAETSVAAVADVTNLAVVPSEKTVVGPAAVGVHVAYEVEDADPENNSVTVYADFFNTPSTLSIRHAGLGAAGLQLNDRGYFVLAHESRTGVQNGYYLWRVIAGDVGDDNASAQVVGRLLFGEGIGVRADNHLAHTYDGLLALGFKRKLEVRDDNSPQVPGSATFSHKGIKKVSFSEDATPRAAQMGSTLYLTGSQLWGYDGVGCYEAAFHMFPDMLSGDLDVDTGTVDADIPGSGTFNYRVYYERYTSSGERIRSAAITRVTADLNGRRVILTIPTLAFTGADDVSIVVYRSEVNTADLYYRVSSADVTTAGDVNGYLANDLSTNTVEFIDGMPDTTLVDQEPDYITQGELPNFAPEGPEFVTTVQSRLWLVGGGQFPEQVRYSKLRFEGEAVSFCNQAVTDAPQYGGRHVGLGYVNETPVVFKESAAYALEGEGPDNTGQSGGYRIRPISFDSGCAAPGSIYSATEGVYFQSTEQINLLNQGFNIVPVGTDVDAYKDQVITSTLGVPDTNQVIFLTADGTSLMFDTSYNQWSTFTNHEGLGACVAGNTYFYLRANSDLYELSGSAYSDAGSGYKLKFRTAPLRLKDEIQGFWRCRRMGVVGAYLSSHRLQVSVYYDRDEAPYEVFIWEPDDVLELGTWGSEATWGEADTLWGGARGGRDYRFTHRLKRQKCETIRFEFEDLSAGVALGASFELAELILEVGLRPGIGRLPATRKV